MSLPRIQEVGRLWNDVELRYTSTGKAVCNLPIVFSKRVKDRETGEWRDAGSLFVKGTAWEKLAEHCAESLSKGDEIFVSGELSMREYDRKDGSKGQSLELQVYEVGPSLRWNPAKLSRATRSGETSSTPQVDDPWSTPAASKTSAAPFEDPPPF
jgi:single-strand DNA-binding protein